MIHAPGAGRRVRLIGWSSIGAGLILLALGVWCVTTLNGPSFDVNTFAGARPSAHDLSLFIVELMLVVAGTYSVVAGIVTLRKNPKQTTFARSMRFVDPEFATTPLAAVSGRCWQCGGKVRAASPICYVCGATQAHGRRGGTPGDSAIERGWDLGAPDAAPFPAGLASPPRDVDAPVSQWSLHPYETSYQSEAPESWEGPTDLPPPPPNTDT
ncbi:MAG: hypothetical protein ACRDHP_00055 [Ktedonobacterales bacterium]